jgi:histidinol dehydrogenase
MEVSNESAQKKVWTVGEVLDIAKGVQVLDSNVDVAPNIAFRVGKLGGYCKSVQTRVEKEQTKVVNNFNKERGLLIGKKEEKDFSQEVKDQLTELANKMQEDLKLIQEEEVEEFKTVELKLSDFIAKEEVKRLVSTTDKDGVVKNEWLIIKAGGLLVPTGFFRYMGDMIKDTN